MQPVSTLTQKYKILINDTDFTKKMKLSSAFNYFQEIAHLHSDNLGVGMHTILEEHNLIWVLVKIRVDILRYPRWDEDIIAETWPLASKKYEFERNYFISDLNGEILARGVSSWVILDRDTRELVKSETIGIHFPEFRTDRAIDCQLGKIRIPGEPGMVYKRLIGCSDIDMNGHLNNSKYVDFIMDCFNMEQLKRSEARSIQVSYLSEALPGDTIVLYKYTDSEASGRIYVKGVRESDEGAIFTTVLETRMSGSAGE